MLNELDNKRQFTKYKRHVNDSHERVNANTVNKLQLDVNKQQFDTNTIKDTQFEERVYTIFNNNLFVNSMFIDLFRTGEYINMNNSNNIVINFEKSQLTIDKDYSNAISTSFKIASIYGDEIGINDFFLISNEYIPVGADIKYYLELYNGERYPITSNKTKTPLHLNQDLKYGFKLVTELQANNLNQKPYINGYAILYFDTKVEEMLGMTNPDLRRFP